MGLAITPSALIKSFGTGEEASCQKNHTPTSMDDWATLSMRENSTTKCVTCVNMLEVVKVMSAQVRSPFSTEKLRN